MKSKEVFIILHAGEVYCNAYHCSWERAANFIRMRNPRKKFKEGTDENVFKCARTGARFTIVELKLNK